MFEDEMAFAHEVADEASAIAMSLFGTDLDVRMKSDRTPVTQADVAIEAMVRDRVAVRFPGHAVLGEEGGLGGGDQRRCWIVDPIDGTKNFTDAIQVWATLLALEVDGERVLGLASAPALGERYEAVAGGGARLNGRPISVSTVDRLSEALVLYADAADWLAGPHAEQFRDLVRAADRDRGFGDFWGHMLVARGSAAAMLEPELAIWDYAAVEVIVREAGGRITAFDGGPLEPEGSVLSTNGALHDEFVARLSSSKRSEG